MSADAVLSVPNSVFGADTVGSIPEPGSRALHTVWPEGSSGADTSVSIPDIGWSGTAALVVDDLPGSRAAVADMEIFIPDVSGITSDTFHVDWVPVFRLIASDTELSSNKITGWTAALRFVSSEAVVGEGLVVSL